MKSCPFRGLPHFFLSRGCRKLGKLLLRSVCSIFDVLHSFVLSFLYDRHALCSLHPDLRFAFAYIFCQLGTHLLSNLAAYLLARLWDFAVLQPLSVADASFLLGCLHHVVCEIPR